MNPKERLSRIEWIDHMIANRQEEIELMKERAMSVTCQPKTSVVYKNGEYVKTIMPPSGGRGIPSDKVGDSVAAYVDLQNGQLNDLLTERDEIARSIELVGNVLFYDILWMRYVLHKNLKEIAWKLDRSYSQITTAHGRALTAYKKAMEEQDERGRQNKEGDRIRIIRMSGEPRYTGRKGIVTSIDGMGHLHGTWGFLALIPGEDEWEIAEKENGGAE